MRVGKDTLLREAQAAVFKALGHPARLKMVEALADGPLCVCELVELAGLSQPTVSRHLDVLAQAGAVSKARDGGRVMVRLDFPCILNALPCINEALGRRAKAKRATYRRLTRSAR
jgi:ArsR family transcriptional regulator